MDSNALKGFRLKITPHDYYYYKNIILENGTVLTLGYRKEFSYLEVKFSVPKLLYGTNAIEMQSNHISNVINIVNNILAAEHINADFASFRISRIELSRNYNCKNEREKMNYIDVLKRRDASRKESKNYMTSAVFYNKSCRLTIYDKKAEMLAHGDAKYINEVTAKILRVEYKVRKTTLKKYTKNLSVENVLCNLDLNAIFADENRKTGIFGKVLSYNRFFSVLNRLICGKSAACQKKIIAFYKDVNIIGEPAAKAKYSKYVFRTYSKIMKDEGYNIMYSYSHVQFIDFYKTLFPSITYAETSIKQIIKRCQKTVSDKPVKYRDIKVAEKHPLWLSYPLFLHDTS